MAFYFIHLKEINSQILFSNHIMTIFVMQEIKNIVCEK